MEPSFNQHRSQRTFGLIVVLLILGWTSVFLRFWVRIRITKNPGWDDATILGTLCLFSCYCAFILVIGAALQGPKTVDSIKRIILYVQLGEIFYILTTTLLKISLGLFFLRLLTKRWQVLLFYTILAVSAVSGVFYAFVATFQCGVPSNLLNNVLHGSRQCLPDWFLLVSGYLYGSINVIADWTFVLVPILILMESDMDRRAKVSVGVVMGLGAIGSISSILRMVFLKGLLLGGTVNPDAVKATFWATAEPGTGIIAVSVAILRPLFRQVKAEVRDKMSEYSSNKSVGSNGSGSRNGSAAGLASFETNIFHHEERRKKMSMYSIPSPTWDENIPLEQTKIAKVIDIRVSHESTLAPQPPPKP